MTHKKRLLRHYHTFHTSNNNISLCENNQGQDSKDTCCHMRLPPFNTAPDIYCPYIQNCGQNIMDICSKNYNKCTIYMKTKIVTRSKSKTGLERFIKRYGESWREMFIGSRK